jgi:uncharacterized protein (DUF2147 family)
MKKTIAFIFILTMVAVVCFAQADPVEGFWLSIDENTNKVTAGWQIYQENGVLFGKILSLADEPRGTIADQCRPLYIGFPVRGVVNEMPVAGTPWIFGLTRRGVGDWRGGSIINPEDGKMYNCRITFHRAGSRVSGRAAFDVDYLEMRGEIFLGIGRSQFWRKTDQQTASNLWPD